MQNLFTFLDPRTRNRKPLKSFLFLNQRLSVRAFGERVLTRNKSNSKLHVNFTELMFVYSEANPAGTLQLLDEN